MVLAKVLLKHDGQSTGLSVQADVDIDQNDVVLWFSLFDMVNVHLFHDASNLLAAEKSPSIYTQFRKKCFRIYFKNVSVLPFSHSNAIDLQYA